MAKSRYKKDIKLIEFNGVIEYLKSDKFEEVVKQSTSHLTPEQLNEYLELLNDFSGLNKKE